MPSVERVVVVDEPEVAHPAVDPEQVERRRADEVDGRLVRAEEVAGSPGCPPAARDDRACGARATAPSVRPRRRASGCARGARRPVGVVGLAARTRRATMISTTSGDQPGCYLDSAAPVPDEQAPSPAPSGPRTEGTPVPPPRARPPRRARNTPRGCRPTLPNTRASVVPVVATSAGGAPACRANEPRERRHERMVVGELVAIGSRSRCSDLGRRPAGRRSPRRTDRFDPRLCSSSNGHVRVHRDPVAGDALTRHRRGPVAAADRADVEIDRVGEQVVGRRRGGVQLGLEDRGAHRSPRGSSRSRSSRCRPSAACPGTPVIRTLNQSTPTCEVVIAAPNGSAMTAASAV